MDYYEILGVTKDASFEEIKEAYFALRKGLSGPELDLLEMAYRTLANDSKRADYDMGLNSHNRTVKINEGNGFREKLYKTIDFDNPEQEIVLSFDENPDLEEIHSINTYNTLEKEAEDLVNPEEKDDLLDFYLTPREISRALALLVRGDGEEYIEGTNVIKPRDRRVDETDEEYTAFLEKYYQEHFYIPGTNILKPRDRKVNETNEEYNNYLANYYAIIFANQRVQEDIDEEEYEDDELLEVTDRKSHPKLKKIVRGLLVAGALLLGVLGIKACSTSKDSKAPYGSNTTVDEAIDDAGNTIEEDYSDYDDYVEELEHSIVNPEIDDLPEIEEDVEEDYTISVGDNFNLNENTLLYTASTDQEAKGRVNTNAAAPGEYTIDKIVVLDSNNRIIANSSFGEVDLDSYDDSYKKMIHFSRNVTVEDIETGRVERNNEKNLGWVFLENLSADQKIDNVLDRGKTK